jgi:hypothetical protein
MSEDMQLKWKVTAMDCYPEFSGATDYVFNVHWDCLSYYNGVSGGPYYGRVYSVTSVPASPGPFTPYDKLTENQVLDWVYSVMPSGDKERFENSSVQQIVNQITPPVVTPPAPWPPDVFPVIAPSVSAQPPTGVSYWSGDKTTFFATIEGQPLAMQWNKDNTPVSGANTYILIINEVQPSDAGTYTLSASNSLGSVQTSGCVLTVNPPCAPSITMQPNGGTVPISGFYSLIVSSNGHPIPICKWTRDGIDVGGGNIYSIQCAKPEDAGTYKALVYNDYGSVESNPAVVEVV